MAFITIEGIEGSGKTTLLDGLLGALRAAGRDPLATREPGGTPAGDAMRAIFLDLESALNPWAETLLLNASRAQLVAEVLGPALGAGRIVLCDRFVDSTIAYQGYGRGLDIERVRQICDIASNGLTPDLTFFVDVSVTTSQSRVLARSQTADRIENQDRAFHERVRGGFHELARQHERIVVLDGEAGVEAIAAAAMRAFEARIR
ncbi:MAG: dTMP kinase [Vulcanimicrobiaceae bacterium]